MMRIAVQLAPRFSYDTPTVLFEGRYFPGGGTHGMYDLAPDGRVLTLTGRPERQAPGRNRTPRPIFDHPGPPRVSVSAVLRAFRLMDRPPVWHVVRNR